MEGRCAMTQLLFDNAREMLHVRFDGRSEELPLATLNLDRQATDAEIKRALCAYFDRPARSFERHVIVRHSGAIVVRPEAIYG